MDMDVGNGFIYRMQAVIISVRPLLLECCVLRVGVGNLKGMIVVEVAGHGNLVGLRVGHNLVTTHLWILFAGDAEDAVGALFEVHVSQDFSESEVAVERQEGVAACLVLRAHSRALFYSKDTPILYEMAERPPCLNYSSSLRICLRS